MEEVCRCVSGLCKETEAVAGTEFRIPLNVRKSLDHELYATFESIEDDACAMRTKNWVLDIWGRGQASGKNVKGDSNPCFLQFLCGLYYLILSCYVMKYLLICCVLNLLIESLYHNKVDNKENN